MTDVLFHDILFHTLGRLDVFPCCFSLEVTIHLGHLLVSRAVVWMVHGKVGRVLEMLLLSLVCVDVLRLGLEKKSVRVCVSSQRSSYCFSE